MWFLQKPLTLVGVLYLTSYYNPLFSSLPAFPSNTGSHFAALLLTSSLFIWSLFAYTTWPSFACQPYKSVRQGQWAWSATHRPLPIICSSGDKKVLQVKDKTAEQWVFSLLSPSLHPFASLLLRLSRWLIRSRVEPKSCDECSSHWTVTPDLCQRLCQI